MLTRYVFIHAPTSDLSMTKQRRTGLIVAAVVVGLLAWGGYEVRQLFRRIRAEYQAAQVITLVGKFVDSHEGRWPTSWDELGAPEHLRDGDVRIDFDVDPERLIEDPLLIYSVITPYSGSFRKFPHSKLYLNDLRRIIAEKRNALDRMPPDVPRQGANSLIDR
jgi:hypothetical protein